MNFNEYVRQEHRRAFEERMNDIFPAHYVSDIIDNLDDDGLTEENLNVLRLYLDGILGMDKETFMNYDNRRLVQSSMLEKMISIWNDASEGVKSSQFLMNSPLSIHNYSQEAFAYHSSDAIEFHAALVVCMANHSNFNNATVCTDFLTAYYTPEKKSNQTVLDLVAYYSEKSGIKLTLETIFEQLQNSTTWIEQGRNVDLVHLLNRKPEAMDWFVKASQKECTADIPLAWHVAGNCETANIAAKDIQAIMAMLLHVAQHTTNPSHKWQLSLKIGLTLCRDKYEDREFPGVKDFLQESNDPRLIFLSAFAGKKDSEKLATLTEMVKVADLQEFSEKVIKISQRSTAIKNKLLVLIANPEHKKKQSIMRNAIEHELGV